VTGERRVPGVLVTHGRLGLELLRTAESILGPQPAMQVVSNSGKSPEGLQAEIEALLPPSGPVVVLVDLLGGSCGHACALVRRGRPDLLLAGGVNLPMLLEFLCHRGSASPGDLRERLLTRGRDGIRLLGWAEEEPA